MTADLNAQPQSLYTSGERVQESGKCMHDDARMIEALREWLPIESAPKDGTWIQLAGGARWQRLKDS